MPTGRTASRAPVATGRTASRAPVPTGHAASRAPALTGRANAPQVAWVPPDGAALLARGARPELAAAGALRVQVPGRGAGGGARLEPLALAAVGEQLSEGTRFALARWLALREGAGAGAGGPADPWADFTVVETVELAGL